MVHPHIDDEFTDRTIRDLKAANERLRHAVHELRSDLAAARGRVAELERKADD